LINSAEIATGDAQFCQNCKSMLNCTSITTKIDDNIRKNWICEFCQHKNELEIEDEEIPKVDVIDFLLESASNNENKEDCNTILFLIDISGSMCVTTEVEGKIELKGAFNAESLNIDTGGENQWMPNQKRNVTYISRLQCVQASIEKQIQILAKNNPNKKVGIITFNHEVTVIGDGTINPINIGGDKLENFEKLF